MRERGLAALVAALVAGCVFGPRLVASADESGFVEVGGRTYRDVSATCFRRPFLTDADMRIYFTDTRGRVAGRGLAQASA